MAPKRSADRKQPDDNDDNDKVPTWDSTPRNLMLYLLKLRRWLPRQHPQLMSFLRHGYILNSKQEVVVYDDKHRDKLVAGTLSAGTFERPCAVGIAAEEFFEAAEEPDGEEETPASKASGKDKPDTTPGSSAASLVGKEASRFKISPEALAHFEETVVETVLDTFVDEDTQEEWSDQCAGSIRTLLAALHNEARSISSADDTNIEARQEELLKRGIDEATLAAFNSFKSRYRAFNSARKSPKADGQMANDYAQVVGRLGEHIDARLESKLDGTNAHGNLAKTLKAIRMVLSKFEANKETNFLLQGKAGGGVPRPRSAQRARRRQGTRARAQARSN